MRRFFLWILLSGVFYSAKADHITGGEMFYTYLGASGGIHNYSVTLKLFMRCGSGRQFSNPTIISVFDKQNGVRIRDVPVALSHSETISLDNNNPCITNPPTVCYEVGYYDFTISLPGSPSGYVLASEVNYRIRGINNIAASQVGATYTCEIPGTSALATAPINNSAVFTGSDLVVICTNNSFSYSFNAKDPDGDRLNYYFCSAYASSTGGTNGVPAGAPPYQELPYSSPYNAQTPLGGRVNINASTGLITGIGPESGIFVVTVCVDEIRNGQLIATQRKDVQVNVTECSIAAASLPGDYMLCGLTRTVNITNQSTSPLIVSNDWAIYNPAGTIIYSYSGPELLYTFASNGVYKVKLAVNRGQQCSDSATTNVFVFPGLVPDFDFVGICINKPTIFTDKTTFISGAINSWKWDVGEGPYISSSDQNTSYTYTSQGDKNVQLIITTTDGCRDTVMRTVPIVDKPPLGLTFRDTLICLNDILQLHATATGDYTWSPAINMINPNSASPVVSPTVTTTYYADLDAEGCTNTDSVLVRVVDHVTLQPMSDTTICSGDAIQMHINSNGLHYSWTPGSQLIDPLVKNPVAITPATTIYEVKAVIGGCSALAPVQVRTVPYPLVNAGADTIICYETKAQLHASTNGNSWQWSPASSVTFASSLNTVVFPALTTNYILTVFDTKGCPKPSRDTVNVKVLPNISAFAGRDTSVIIGQPLQMNGSEGYQYRWSPALYLSATDISNPVAIVTEAAENLSYKLTITNEVGCSDSAYMQIKVFATGPTVFVPTGFTPNNDGKNDVLRPTAVGIQRIAFFNIYNRWGQLIFSTSGNSSQGWDGRINGQAQGNNTYVWMVKAIDFKGASYFQKGTVTLVR